MIPKQFLPFILENKDKWYGTKGHKTCSVCGYNTRNFQYHSYISKDIELHLRDKHHNLFEVA